MEAGGGNNSFIIRYGEYTESQKTRKDQNKKVNKIVINHQKVNVIPS